MNQKPPGAALWPALLANAFIIGVFAYAGVIHQLDPDLYYQSVQEDEYLEWCSFFAFLLAGFGYLLFARQRQNAGQLAWFVYGVAIFCIFVALEEISWGQRIIGYRPPNYFLEQNFQQELNFHNVVETSYRKIALYTIIIGFGLLLPVASMVPRAGQFIARCGITPSPRALIPAFLATALFYAVYPWTHSGEWVELMLGLGFLFAALWGSRALTDSPRLPATLIAGSLLVLALGAGGATLSRVQRSGHTENLTAARIELDALKADFLNGKMRVRCDVHKRLYTYVQKYGQNHLLSGEFSTLTATGLPDARASYLLDPWNSPYWIRDNCANNETRRTAFVYSFGPNRRRESTRSRILGDDVGVIIFDSRPVE